MDFFHEIQIGQAGERAEGQSPVHIAGNHVQMMSANHPIPPPYHDQIQGEGVRTSYVCCHATPDVVPRPYPPCFLPASSG